LKKIITGCRLSNTASQRSIEKTPGFEFQGIVKDRKNDQGEFEEERRYAIKRKDWARLYADVKVDLVR
jgi:RimJ/RimL family protein N-acetyltransferase